MAGVAGARACRNFTAARAHPRGARKRGMPSNEGSNTAQIYSAEGDHEVACAERVLKTERRAVQRQCTETK